MFKICPRCGDEFVQHVVECPDCRVPLRTADDLASADASGGASDPPGSGLAAAVMLRRGATSELRELGERLAERGVRFVVDTDPPSGKLARPSRDASGGLQLAIYVEEADATEATLVQREWLIATVPDAAAASSGGMIDACPGCSEPLAASATSCTSCGLEFPPLEVACPQCGRGVAPEAERCPSCGYRP
jgi:hypothetical protein